MIKDNQTIDGLPISNLAKYSRKQVIKVCDLCFCEVETSWQDVARSRSRHESDKDYCHPCSMKVYNTGAKNSSKKQEIKNKISQATKGKSKKFRDGRNLRRLPFKKAVNGYILVWSEKENKHVPYHRAVVADHNQITLSDSDIVHHIDGNKLNNNPNNLVVVHGVSEHQQLHSQLEKVAMSLVQNGMIRFNPVTKQYYIEPNLELANLPLSLGFQDVAIQQKKNICTSRLDVKIESEIIRGVVRPIPLIAANMSTVINPEFYKLLYKLGAFGVLHRAQSQEEIINDIIDVSKECEWVASSLGIESNQFEFAKKMISKGCNILVIDVAHGYSDIVFDLAKKIKKYAPFVKVVIGNTTNVDCLLEAYEFVDAIKVGIANGLACETKNTAGCNEKQFSSVFKFKELSKQFGIPIISDGGLREPADFTKAIGAGASSVMAGSVFAACPESASPVVNQNGTLKKLYAGMASEYVQNIWKGGLKPGTVAEGGIRYLDIGEPVEKLLTKYSGALRSGITYSGSMDIETFQKSVKFVRV